MLDANKHFLLPLNAIAGGIPGIKKPFIVMGVGYDINLGYDITQRMRDCTPKVEGDEFAKGGGEADFWLKCTFKSQTHF